MHYLRIVLPLFLLLGVGNSAYSANFNVTGKVDEILVNRSSLGMCAIRLAGYSAPGTCGSRWISLDCKGDFHGKEVGRSMMELSQIAKATNRPLRVSITDSQKQNGKCAAFQMILQ